MLQLTSFYQYVLLLLQLNSVLSHSLPSTLEDTSSTTSTDEQSTIFDPRVLRAVKALYTQRLQLQHGKGTKKMGIRKSIIETGNYIRPGLPIKVDPRAFGQTLISQAEKNAARKSDIYMNKAIDATALGVAVLKLIFGKDAKMVMKDAKNSDTQDPSLRTEEFRPEITSWSTPLLPGANAERKSSLGDRASNVRKSDKISQLSTNILKLVKGFKPMSGLSGDKSSETAATWHGNINNNYDKIPNDGETNLARLLRLFEENKRATKEQKGAKKSWVLLKVKQPQDEIGMLSDHSKSEENGSDEIARPQLEIKHEERPKERHILNSKKFRNNEVKSLTNPVTSSLKSLKSEPVHEVNPVKTDRTAASYDSSAVTNLLSALESTSDRTSPNVDTKKSTNEQHVGSSSKKLELLPVRKTEENAAAKDSLTGSENPAAGAVVSLDALRQLGKLLGMATQNSETRISPYTGTADTLKLATPMAPETRLKELMSSLTTPAPTKPPIPPTPPPPVPVRYSENREMALNRISEQLKMFAERGLRSHNEYRKLHQAQPLKWSEDLASAAEKLAYQAAKSGAISRSEMVEQKGYGENVARIPNIMLENAGEEATRHWYNEKEKFTFSDPEITDATKAFTQLIWKGTTELGMGAAKDDDTGELYVIALYKPKGNHDGTLRENVQSDGKQNVDVYASIFKKSNPVHLHQT